MKKGIALASLFLMTALTTLLLASKTAIAAEKVIKECSTSMKQLDSDKIVNTTMQIVSKDDGSVYSKVAQSMDGSPAEKYNDVAEIFEGSVRENLTPDSDPESLSRVEGYIVHAMALTSDPELGDTFSAGIDLSKVRFAKVYLVGKETNMGSSGIVEAYDGSNRVLGSFLGGFLVTPCK